MSGRGLILAAHGSRYEPAVNAQIRSLAAAIADRSLFDHVSVAFHQGHPAFHEVIDGMEAHDVVVVPLLTSAGYYSDLVLPRELKRNRRYNEVRVCQTIPLGLHVGMFELVADRIRAACEHHQIQAAATSIAIVGHGTPRHSGSRSSTESVAAALANRAEWPQVFAAFIDEEPCVESVPSLAGQANLIVVPFLIGAGPHAITDIPARLGLHVETRSPLPVTGTVGARNVVCDAPMGSDPRIIDLIIDLAVAADFEDGRRPKEAVA